MGDTLQVADLSAALPPNPLVANATSLGAPQIATGKTTPVGVPKNPEDNLTVARRQREQGENPSHDPNAQNPYSSAGGTNQIIDSTWLELLTKHKPGLVEGKTKEELLAMKLDGNLNTEMANAYDRDNAKFLASNGIAPTPNFLNAAYRAGPQGAMAIIQAAHTNPNALVKDVAPDMGKPGNNGAGDLTVGQFLMNPYQRGPGADANQSPQQLFTIAKGNQILSQLQTELDQGKARVAKLDRDYKPIEFPTMPKPPEVDPLQTFGSLAGVFATLAAGFSRTPMTAALNGLAGAMHAAKEAKWDDYKAHYDQFKFGTEMAIKAHEMHSADIKDALEMMQKNMAAGSAMLTATIELSQDEEARKDHAIGHYIRLGQRQDEKDKNALEIKNGLPVYYATVDLTTALENLKHAQKGGDPNEITQAEGLVTQAENKLAGIKRAQLGGAKPQTPQQVALQRFMDENPAATSQEIQAFITNFKEDAPGVAARKDRVQIERERHDKRAEELANDRTLSQDERAASALEERIKHDRAMEGKDHTTAVERQQKLYEDDIRKEPAYTNASAAELRTEANRRIAGSKRPEEQHLSPEALDMEATQLLLTGTMPSLGFGGTSARVQIINRAAVLAAEQGKTIEDYISGRATWKADASSLSQITKISDAVQGFENTALENMKVAESLMEKGAGTRVGPVINRWLQAGKSATGDADVAAFNTAMGTVAGEYGKIISGGSASIAATPEGARKEAADWLDKIQSPQAIKAQFAVARRDMENRKNSLFRQRGLIQERIKDPTAKVSTTSAAPDRSAFPEASPGEVVHQDANGNRAVQRDGKWVEVR